jgi:hypothetical protein
MHHHKKKCSTCVEHSGHVFILLVETKLLQVLLLQLTTKQASQETLEKAWITDHAVKNAVGGISGQSKKLVNECAEAVINFEQVCQGSVELKGRKMGLGFRVQCISRKRNKGCVTLWPCHLH